MATFVAKLTWLFSSVSAPRKSTVFEEAYRFSARAYKYVVVLRYSQCVIWFHVRQIHDGSLGPKSCTGCHVPSRDAVLFFSGQPKVRY